ncbi:thioesterase family protein [Microbacterium panaciterrae]|uniref:Tol-pal system-associated acyl-CoA thioesterase n=1 Tax=Microbacterium panaciterrae TaxID=985759 RepID=A0ABP8PLH2_9MICO
MLHSDTRRLSYNDTDPAGILYYASWFPKMEALWSDFLYRSGFRQDHSLAARGWTTVTRATECEYLVAARLFDEIRLELGIGRIGVTSFQIDYRMVRLSDDAVVSRAKTTIVLVDGEQRAIRIPGDFRDRLQEWAA